MPQLPSFKMPRIRINWKALMLPPLIVAGVAAAGGAAQIALDQPVGTLVIEGPFQRVTPMQVQAALALELEEGFLSLELEELRQRVQSLPWVDETQLRRAWPDRLIVRVTEHRAAARWGDNGLLNVRGELFGERAAHAFPELPKLAGPEGSELQVASLYLALRGRLADAHLAIDTLSMDERGAWHLELASGQEVRLGRRDVRERVDRFFAVVAPALVNEFDRVSYVDLRYTNGFAVGWVEDAPATELAVNEEHAGHG